MMPSETRRTPIAETLPVYCSSFAEAELQRRDITDEFIEQALTESLNIDGERVSLTTYLNKVPATEADNALLAEPAQIAAIYESTTAMLGRNLTLLVHKHTDPDAAESRKQQLKVAKVNFLGRLGIDKPQTMQTIIDWSEDKTRSFPVPAVEYKGFTVAGQDVLTDDTRVTAYLANFHVLRQPGGTYLRALSRTETWRQLYSEQQPPTMRIYLNPQFDAVPQVFEEILTAANHTKLPLQLKMLQRVTELAMVHRSRLTHPEKPVHGLRGDGIVVLTDDDTAEKALSIVLSVAKNNVGAFLGRQASRIAHPAADGIALGAETGFSGLSLTSHRAQMLEIVTQQVQQSGKTGPEAIALFRRGIIHYCMLANVNYKNLAFNA